MKELPKDGLETSRGALWLGIGTFFASKLDYHRPPSEYRKASRSRSEILKLNELRNDGFETSRCALWLVIGTVLRSKLEYHRPPGAGPKS